MRPDFTRMLQALSTARVEDFVRHVGRRLEADPAIEEMPFGVAWPILLSGYAEMALRLRESPQEATGTND